MNRVRYSVTLDTMVGLSVLLLAAGAPSIAVLTPATTSVSAEERSVFVAELARAIEETTGIQTRVEGFAATAEELRESAPDTDVVTVQMVSGVRLARVTIERQPVTGEPTSVELEYSRDSTALPRRLRGVAQILFAQIEPPSVAAPSVEVTTVPPESGGGATAAWIAGGVGAAMLIAATVFRIIAEAARADADVAQAPEDFEGPARRSRRFGLASNVGFVAGAALVAGSVVYLGATW